VAAPVTFRRPSGNEKAAKIVAVQASKKAVDCIGYGCSFQDPVIGLPLSTGQGILAWTRQATKSPLNAGLERVIGLRRTSSDGRSVALPSNFLYASTLENARIADRFESVRSLITPTDFKSSA